MMICGSPEQRRRLHEMLAASVIIVKLKILQWKLKIIRLNNDMFCDPAGLSNTASW